MITRPALDEVYAYRAHVDQAVASLLGLRPTREVAELIELECHHERRHQELLLTDILHLLAQNPSQPHRDPPRCRSSTAVLPALSFTDFEVGNGRVVLLHTEVPQEPSGLGYGSRLAHGVFEALRRDGKRVIAKCPFMSSYAARHPEYGALLDG